MLTMNGDDPREEWDLAMREFDDVLEDLGLADGNAWDPVSLAVFLDVPSLAIAGLIPKARAAGIAADLDFIARVRTGVATAMAELRKAGVMDARLPLPIEFGLTGALLVWDWTEMEAAGEEAHFFFDRLRELRLKVPEVALCERTVHPFCKRVPLPRFPR